MQPFDALSIRATLSEAKPILLNKRVDKVLQLARDEILINLRSKSGTYSLFLSAQSVYGRMCLVRIPSSKDTADEKRNEKSIFERYKSKYGNNTPPNFCVVLRKHLTGATLIGVEQIPGERIVDFAFSATDEVGTTSVKILTAEIMGRHSNLIFWDKESKSILASSHNVTSEMSRQREVLPNIAYERPPVQDRPNIFLVEEKTISSLIEKMFQEGNTDDEPSTTLTQWLLSTFTGLGRHLSEELISSTGLENDLKILTDNKENRDKLLSGIKELREMDSYKPSMHKDLGRYSLLGWYQDKEPESWQSFTSVNELVESYFRALEAKEHYMQLREKIKAEINSETSKLEARKTQASSHLKGDDELEHLKQCGDMILTNVRDIEPGQAILKVESWEPDSDGNGGKIEIELNPNLSSVANAQSYYRKYAKGRARRGAAQATIDEVEKRLASLDKLRTTVESAPDINELKKIKDNFTVRKHSQQKPQPQKSKKGKGKAKLVSLISSDGWTIYVGRNKNENDHLIGKIANPNDLWFHVSGSGGAHVLVRVPQTKQDPPKTTIQEAAQVAARLSKKALGSKVRVIYTRCKHVKKVDKNKPGLVRYEFEKTVEVDTGKPMPKLMKKLFAKSN